MSIQDIIARALPYTVGNGAPGYRTDPITHQKYSQTQMAAFASETGKTYDMPNVYIQEEQHALNING